MKKYVSGMIAILLAGMLTGCGGSGASSSPNSNAVSSGEGEAVAEPEPAPSHNYDEKEGRVYYYTAALSDDDRKSGKGAKDVLGFIYVGKNRAGNEGVIQVNGNGYPMMSATCSNPCSIIHLSNGEVMSYNRETIIGSVFEDIMHGFLEGPKRDVASSNDSLGPSSSEQPASPPARQSAATIPSRRTADPSQAEEDQGPMPADDPG